MVQNPTFEAAIREKINSRIDTAELDAELTEMQKRFRQLNGTKAHLGRQIDTLEYDDPHYDRKAQDLQERLDSIYDEIAAVETNISDMQMRIKNIQMQKISGDNVYQFLLYFDKLYDRFTDAEKKEFLNSFIEKVEIYPEKLPNGRILKRIEFRFPVFWNGKETEELSWDDESTAESVSAFIKTDD